MSLSANVVKNYHNTGLDALLLKAFGAQVVVIRELGAMVHSIKLIPKAPKQGADSEPVEILYGDRDDELKKNPLFRGRLLFPFNDRIPGARYEYRQKQYLLPINDPENGDAIHGFLYKTAMNTGAIKKSRYSIAAHFNGILQATPGYPFRLKIWIQYILRKDSFEIKLKVKNMGKNSAPLSLGWHPYFRLPDFERVDSLSMKLSAEKYFETDENAIPTGKIIRVDKTAMDFRSMKRIKNANIDHAFMRTKGGAALSDGNYCLSLQASKVFAYFQVFIPEDRKSIAIEPVTAAPNAFNNKIGLINLKRKSIFRAGIKVHLK